MRGSISVDQLFIFNYKLFIGFIWRRFAKVQCQSFHFNLKFFAETEHFILSIQKSGWVLEI